MKMMERKEEIEDFGMTANLRLHGKVREAFGTTANRCLHPTVSSTWKRVREQECSVPPFYQFSCPAGKLPDSNDCINPCTAEPEEPALSRVRMEARSTVRP